MPVATALAALLRSDALSSAAALRVAPPIIECFDGRKLTARWVETLGLDWELPASDISALTGRALS